MSLLLDAAIRSSALLIIGLGVAALLRHRAAALRHAVLAAAVLGSAAVVPLSYAIPSWNVEVAPVSTAGLAIVDEAPVESVAVAVAGESEPVRRWSIVTAAWLTGFAIVSALLLFRLSRLVRLSARAARVADRRWTDAVRRTCAAYGINRPVLPLETDASDVLATWGVLRPRVLLPAGARAWSDDRIHVVLCHELAHIRRHDWFVQMAADIVRSVYWFNPLMWIVCQRLRRESEHACDDVVMNAGVAAPDYATHLLDLARTSRRVLAIPMARRSTLERRIAVMLKTDLDRRAVSRPAMLAVAALLLCAALPAAALRATQSGPLPLAGTLYDQTGAVLPGVDVALQDWQEFKWQATSDSAGHFEFPPVQPGKYVLEVALPGFKTLRNEFTLTNARDWDRSIILQVGELSETVTVKAARATRPPQNTAAGQPLRVRVGGNIKAPTKTRHVNPVYPETMRDAGLGGVVPLDAIIGVDGLVTSIRVLGAAVHPDFAQAAADAVGQWRFTPTLLNGVPVEVVMKVTVNFAIE